MLGSNSRSLKCFSCGEILVPATGLIVPRGFSFLTLFSHSGGYSPTIPDKLTCPRFHDYHLNQIEDFNYNRVYFNEELVEHLATFASEIEGLTPNEILHHNSHQAYMVGFSSYRRLMSRARSGSRVFNANQPLDSLVLLISTLVNSTHIILYGIANREQNLSNRYDYIIVNYRTEVI